MQKQGKSDSEWVSLSDMMTWLMLIFLLISIVTISNIQSKNLNQKEVVQEYNNARNEIYADLKKILKENETEWNMEIGEDLIIKFSNPDVLFEPDSAQIKQKFQSILNEFIPKYLSVINDAKYKNQIKEVRIEGHTGIWCENVYMYCINLSQDRSNSVLSYIFDSMTFINLSENDKIKLKFWLISNGMSSWRNIDNDWQFIYKSWKPVNGAKSRRVEFQIVTNSDELYEKIKKLQNIK